MYCIKYNIFKITFLAFLISCRMGFSSDSLSVDENERPVKNKSTAAAELVKAPEGQSDKKQSKRRRSFGMLIKSKDRIENNSPSQVKRGKEPVKHVGFAINLSTSISEETISKSSTVSSSLSPGKDIKQVGLQNAVSLFFEECKSQSINARLLGYAHPLLFDEQSFLTLLLSFTARYPEQVKECVAPIAHRKFTNGITNLDGIEPRLIALLNEVQDQSPKKTLVTEQNAKKSTYGSDDERMRSFFVKKESNADMRWDSKNIGLLIDVLTLRDVFLIQAITLSDIKSYITPEPKKETVYWFLNEMFPRDIANQCISFYCQNYNKRNIARSILNIGGCSTATTQWAINQILGEKDDVNKVKAIKTLSLCARMLVQKKNFHAVIHFINAFYYCNARVNFEDLFKQAGLLLDQNYLEVIKLGKVSYYKEFLKQHREDPSCIPSFERILTPFISVGECYKNPERDITNSGPIIAVVKSGGEIMEMRARCRVLYSEYLSKVEGDFASVLTYFCTLPFVEELIQPEF